MNNIRRQTYPPCLILAALDDEVVPFYNSMLFGKQIRKNCMSNHNGICINVEEYGGHQFSGDLRVKVEALAVSFIIGYYSKWSRGLL
jgi:protease II